MKLLELIGFKKKQPEPSKAVLTLDEIAIKQWQLIEQQGWHNKTNLEYLALISSEVGGAVNECRGREPTPELATELADIILRTLDFAKEANIDIATAIEQEQKYFEEVIMFAINNDKEK